MSKKLRQTQIIVLLNTMTIHTQYQFQKLKTESSKVDVSPTQNF